MKRYTVHVTASADADATEIFDWLADRTPQHSVAWFRGLTDELQTLQTLPNRCALAPESRHFAEKIRQLLYGTRPHIYRVLFVVRADRVYVLHVRHGARRELNRNEIQWPEL